MTTYIPDTIAAGVTLDIRVTLTAYPAPEWQLDLLLRGSEAIDLPSTGDGASHVITADAATSSAWPAGKYWYALRATDGDQVDEIETGTIEITPDLATQVAGFDGRDHVEKVLEAIEAVIEGRATLDQESYSINNRSLQRTPLAELLKLRDRYKSEARRKRAARKNGQSLFGRKILTRF